MYYGTPNSPSTTLAEPINESATAITVTDGAVFPPAPNLAVIGTDDDAETILYAVLSGNILDSITRGVQGAAKAWSAGDIIARNWTEKDHHSLIDNVNTVAAGVDTINSAHIGQGGATVHPLANGTVPGFSENNFTAGNQTQATYAYEQIERTGHDKTFISYADMGTRLGIAQYADIDNFWEENTRFFVFNCSNTPPDHTYGYLEVFAFDGSGFIGSGKGAMQRFTDWGSGRVFTRTKPYEWQSYGGWIELVRQGTTLAEYGITNALEKESAQLQVGSSAGFNVVFDWGGNMMRNNNGTVVQVNGPIWNALNFPVEYGAWTPFLTGDEAQGAFSFTQQSGSYCRVGNLLWFQCYLFGQMITRPAGIIFITGLPYRSSLERPTAASVGYAAGINPPCYFRVYADRLVGNWIWGDLNFGPYFDLVISGTIFIG
jgi:hypothetical protein